MLEYYMFILNGRLSYIFLHMRDVTIQSTDTSIRDKIPDLGIPKLKCNELHDV